MISSRSTFLCDRENPSLLFQFPSFYCVFPENSPPVFGFIYPFDTKIIIIK